MTKRRIVIIGGGMAGLSAAYQLTKTKELQALHEVTLYQLGWRLGGKAASGRDAQGRNLEHGLHVWFGCYENTFQMIQEVYATRNPPTGWALQTWQDAVKPQLYTPVGTKNASGGWMYWPLTWPQNDGTPGQGGLLPTWTQMIETVIGWIVLYLTHHEQPPGEAAIAAAGPPPEPVEPKPSSALAAAAPHIRSADGLVGEAARDGFEQALALIGWARDAVVGTIGAGAAQGSSGNLLSDMLDILKATVKGVFEDLILLDAPMISLDGLEFRAWLLKNGADPNIVANSSVTRLVYDALFQYRNGDVAQPDLAAGTGLGTIARLVATYKGSHMWEVQAGMGEVIVGPVYEHLLGAGVKFKFFHKLTSMEPDTSDAAKANPSVKTIRFDLQAATKVGDYNPVTLQDGFVLWPSEPYWEQLVDGEHMQAAGVNFESNWCSWPPVPPGVVLEHGVHFDDVVLAVALGALQQLNTVDPSPCQPLVAKSPRFADWLAKIGIVPSMGVQLWCNPSTVELGWTDPKPATVSGPEYLNIWADMTQVLTFEPWPAPRPQSLHYLTGTYSTDLYRQPKANSGTPAAALADLRAQTTDWLNAYSFIMWPKAQAGPGQFDWSVLTAPANLTGPARLDAQYVRPNIDPTECVTLSGHGTTQYRLHADESGFTNLFLAGEGTAYGFTTSFEGVVMSGAAASRAICGHPQVIIGYDFLERRPSQGPG